MRGITVPYDLLNTRLHIEDKDFALEDGLLPKSRTQGSIAKQFLLLAELSGIPRSAADSVFSAMISNSDKVRQLTESSFLNQRSQRSYLQLYQTRLEKLSK